MNMGFAHDTSCDHECDGCAGENGWSCPVLQIGCDLRPGEHRCPDCEKTEKALGEQKSASGTLAGMSDQFTVRAKYKLDRIEESLGWITPPEGGPGVSGKVRTLHFSAVCDGSAENKRFFASTPGGALAIQATRPEVWERFEVGQAYYLDLSPAAVPG